MVELAMMMFWRKSLPGSRTTDVADVLRARQARTDLAQPTVAAGYAARYRIEDPDTGRALPPLPALPTGVVQLQPRADRELALELARSLREIAGALEAGALKRWVMVTLTAPIAMVHHVVRDALAQAQRMKDAQSQ